MTELMNFAQSVAREAGELILCEREQADLVHDYKGCLLYTSPSPRDRTRSRMPSSA